MMEELLRKWKDTVSARFPLKRAHVTLNPDTAHPRLILSEDCKHARWQPSIQDLPSSPERFDTCHFVLGREEFATGRHFWEVTMGSEGEWVVGIAKKSVERKGYVSMRPSAGIWGIGKWAGGYWATNQYQYCPLTWAGELKIIRVYLNYEGGRVSFYDRERSYWVYEFSEASWAGETLLPFFRVFADAHLATSQGQNPVQVVDNL